MPAGRTDERARDCLLSVGAALKSLGVPFELTNGVSSTTRTLSYSLELERKE